MFRHGLADVSTDVQPVDASRRVSAILINNYLLRTASTPVRAFALNACGYKGLSVVISRRYCANCYPIKNDYRYYFLTKPAIIALGVVTSLLG